MMGASQEMALLDFFGCTDVALTEDDALAVGLVSAMIVIFVVFNLIQCTSFRGHNSTEKKHSMIIPPVFSERIFENNLFGSAVFKVSIICFQKLILFWNVDFLLFIHNVKRRWD